MRWDRLFEDLEDQLASEWEAERAALDSEAERLRLSRVTLRERLIALTEQSTVTVRVSFGRDHMVRGTIAAVGADFVALRPEDCPQAVSIVPLSAVQGFVLEHGDLLRSARGTPPAGRSPLADRVTLGYVLRDAARRRGVLRLDLLDGGVLTGTVDRAGADHLDLAVHDAESPRRASAVREHRIVAFAAIAQLRLDVQGEFTLP